MTMTDAWVVSAAFALWALSLYGATCGVARLDAWAARKAYELGREAYRAGRGRGTCSHKVETLRDAWAWGWQYEAAHTQATEATIEVARLRRGEQ